MPRTKIVATLGPASSNYTTLRKMFAAGLDVVRLNFSHGQTEDHLHSIDLVRKLNKKYRRHIRILQDLEGFRIRVGKLTNGKLDIRKGQTIKLTNNSSPAKNIITFDYPGDLTVIKPASLIYIDDGNIILKAVDVEPDTINAKVLQGGTVLERKGINIPDAPLKFPRMTRNDKHNLAFGIEQHVDFIALSFVRNAADVKYARKLIAPALPNCKIIAKVENKPAIRNIDSIIEAADGIMIARGDMGVSVPIHKVGIIQKYIIKKCNAAGKFVITATEMLEHMTEYTRPTRAEVTDVTNAILDGTDYVMLSAETAIGKHPHLAVKMMNEIIKYTEQHRPTTLLAKDL